MKITELSIKNNRLALGILLSILIMGLATFNTMPRDEMPPFTLRVCSIVTLFPGASPERVELLVTDKIEKIVQEMPEVDFIESESRTGVSIVIVSIKKSETEMRPIWDEIRRKTSDMKTQLPEGVIGPEVNDELADVYGILIGITGEGFTNAELRDVAEEVRDVLIKLTNSAKVELAGIREERIFVEYDNARLAELGITTQGLQQTLAGRNIIFPGGEVPIGDERIMLEPTGSFESVEDLKKTIVKSARGTQVVQLGDVVTIRRGYKEPRASIVKINGEPGIVIGVSVKKGGNIINLGKQVDKKIDELRQIYPIGVDFHRVASLDIAVDDAVDSFMSNVMQSVLVVLVVMLLFLGFRTGMIVASLIPGAIIMTIFIMSRIGIGLNQVSLASLIIALGMLVDNAIVMSESIMVKLEKGEKPFKAALDSARELCFPLLVASLTTSAAFLSFFLAESEMGEIVGQIFVVVSIALLSSWVLSLTIIPMLCMYFITVRKKEKGKTTLFERFNAGYSKILVAGLRKPFFVIGGIVLAFVIGMKTFSFVPFIFFPENDRPVVTVNLELPLGTKIEKTGEVVDGFEQYITDSLMAQNNKQEGVLTFSSYTGEGAPKYDMGYFAPESSPGSAHLLLNTTSDKGNQFVIDKLDQFCFENYPEVTARISRLEMGDASMYPIAIRLSGKDTDKLFTIVDSLKAQLHRIEGTRDISDSWGMRIKKLVVDINQIKARFAGVTNRDIAISLRTNVSGAFTGEFREDDKSIPIMMRNIHTNNLDIDKLENLTISSQYSGKTVPLKQVADISINWEYSKIARRDLFRTVTVYCNIRSGYNAVKITEQIKPWLLEQEKHWGVGYMWNLGGEAEDSAEGMNSVARNLPLSMFIILLLLVGQFNSVRKTIIVLSTIPLGLIGVAFGLFGTRSYFGFMGFLGIISLSGIVINNAIVLLDRIKIELEEFKRSPQDAVVLAARQRFRPIMLTTATTSLGLIPLWIGGGPMWEPMAIGILFGLIFATIITLVFVPVLYRLFYQVSFKEYSLKNRAVAQ